MPRELNVDCNLRVGGVAGTSERAGLGGGEGRQEEDAEEEEVEPRGDCGHGHGGIS